MPLGVASGPAETPVLARFRSLRGQKGAGGQTPGAAGGRGPDAGGRGPDAGGQTRKGPHGAKSVWPFCCATSAYRSESSPFPFLTFLRLGSSSPSSLAILAFRSAMRSSLDFTTLVLPGSVAASSSA